MWWLFIKFNKTDVIFISLINKLLPLFHLVQNSRVNFPSFASNSVQLSLNYKIRLIAPKICRACTKKLSCVKLLMNFKTSFQTYFLIVSPVLLFHKYTTKKRLIKLKFIDILKNLELLSYLQEQFCQGLFP